MSVFSYKNKEGKELIVDYSVCFGPDIFNEPPITFHVKDMDFNSYKTNRQEDYDIFRSIVKFINEDYPGSLISKK